MDTIRFYVWKNGIPDAYKESIKTEAKITNPGLDKLYLEEKFDILDPTRTFFPDYYEVTVVFRFFSQMALTTGIYVSGVISCEAEDVVAKYHQNLGSTNSMDDAIGRLELEDPNTQKYFLYIRARKEGVLRKLVIKIRNRDIKPIISFYSNGKEEK